MIDMTEFKDLLEKQGDALEAFKKRYDDRADKLAADLKAERREREDLEARINRGKLSGGGGDSEAAKSEHKALDRFIRTGDDTEIKSMSVGSDPDGGYTVLPVMSDSMTVRLFDASPMRQIARVEQITSGDAFEELDDRDQPDATWVGENEARPAGETPQLGKWRIPVDEIYALQPVTQRLLDDSSRDLGAWIEGKVTDKFGRSEGTAFINGTGVKQPRGLLTYTNVLTADATRAAGQIQYVKTGGASDFAASNPADALKTLMWTLRTPYRKGAVWTMNSLTARKIDQFKEATTNAYIWRNGLQLGEPASLLGYPVVIDEDMPDTGANTLPVAFGNFKLAYCIVEKRGIKWLRDPYTQKPNTLYYAYRRVGGGLANDDAVKLLKCEA